MSGAWNFTGKYSYHNKKIIIVYALLISFGWHLIWGVLFRVDLKPKDLGMVNITDTVFLGDFLNREHLRKKLVASKSRSAKKIVGFIEKTHNRPDILPKRMYFEEVKEMIVSIEAIDFENLKAESALLTYPEISSPISKVENLGIEGPLENRDIVFMPLKPKLPQLIKDKGQFNTKCKLLVDKYGRVLFIEQLIFSGNLEVDLAVRSYLKKWRFSELGRLRENSLQWGTIVVKLNS